MVLTRDEAELSKAKRSNEDEGRGVVDAKRVGEKEGGSTAAFTQAQEQIHKIYKNTSLWCTATVF